MTGFSNILISNVKNIPSFSIRERTDQFKKRVITKGHVVDQIGRDSPGVGKYEYDYSELQKRVLASGKGGNNYSFGFTTRFFDFKQIKELKS